MLYVLQDFPLFTNYEIVAQLLALKGRNVIGGYRPDADALKRTEFVYRCWSKHVEAFV